MGAGPSARITHVAVDRSDSQYAEGRLRLERDAARRVVVQVNAAVESRGLVARRRDAGDIRSRRLRRVLHQHCRFAGPRTIAAVVHERAARSVRVTPLHRLSSVEAPGAAQQRGVLTRRQCHHDGNYGCSEHTTAAGIASKRRATYPLGLLTQNHCIADAMRGNFQRAWGKIRERSAAQVPPFRSRKGNREVLIRSGASEFPAAGSRRHSRCRRPGL